MLVNHRTRFLLFSVSTILLVSLTVGSANADNPRSSLSSITMEDVRGKPVVFADLVGKKVIVISFWATYCKPCKAEMPFLQKLHEKYSSAGLVVLGISLDSPDTEAQVRSLLDKNHYTYTNCIDRQSLMTDLLNPKTVLPFLVVFDKNGNIALQKDGFSPGEQDGLEATIKGLLP